MSGRISPFRFRLEAAADRLAALAARTSPRERMAIHRESVAVREAAGMLEGEACELCSGKGQVLRDGKDTACSYCGGTGDL